MVLRLIGGLLILTALAIALSRAPERPVETLVARWAPAPSDFIDLEGQLVHLRDEGPRGDPLPIVLLLGTASSLHTWEGWVAELRQRRRVITLDLPGFGLSGASPGDDYRGETYARFVLALLDELQLPRVVLGGNAIGGEVAWRTAALAPARVERLILVDASGPAAPDVSLPLGLKLASLPLVNRIGEYLLPRELVAAGVQHVYGDPARVTSTVVDRYFELALREGNRHALGVRLRQREDETGKDAETKIASLRLPTLVLWGGQDRLLPPSMGERFVQLIPGASWVRFDGLGHAPHEEDPAATLVPVRAFLGIN
jgi:pimeloyl-ACP methyl ester carboxylesterase